MLNRCSVPHCCQSLLQTPELTKQPEAKVATSTVSTVTSELAASQDSPPSWSLASSALLIAAGTVGGGGVWCFIGARGAVVKSDLKMFIEERVSELTILKSAWCSESMSPSPCPPAAGRDQGVQGECTRVCKGQSLLRLPGRRHTQCLQHVVYDV